MQSKADSGIMPNRAPLGYLNTGKKGKSNISLDYPVYRAIPYLFHSVAAGRSLKTTGVLAGLFGLKNRKGGVLKPSSVRAIVTNPFYAGYIRYKGELIEGSHQPLVSQELFENVQMSLSKRCPSVENRTRLRSENSVSSKIIGKLK